MRLLRKPFYCHFIICRYVTKKKANEDAPIRYTPNYEVNKIFTTEQEQVLADYIIKSSQMFYGLPLVECRKLAYEMAITNGIKIPETWRTNESAGVEWVRNFLRRNPRISLRTPEGCSLSRATSFNKHNVDKFFDNLRNAMGRHERFCDGTRIFNLDETGTVTVQKSAKVLAAKGVKQVSKVTSGEKGTLVTTCVIISAAGNHLPPAMVFPRVHFKQHMIAGAPPGTLGLATSSGWMNCDLFLKVMEHFIKHSSSSKENPSLLLYDNHESHLSINVLNIAKENGVTIVTFPPHTTNKLQPLDVGVFKPFSLAYNAAVDGWLMQHPGKPLSIYEVAACVGEAFNKALTPVNITSAFKKCGIFPFDRSVFSEIDFLPSAVTDRPDTSSSIINTAEPETPQNNLQIPSAEPEPGTSTTRTQMIPKTPPQVCESETPRPNQLVRGFIGPEEIRGYPKAEPRKETQKGRKKGRSMIPTDTPEKDELEERQRAKKQTPIEKQKKKAVKRKIHESDDEEENAEWHSDASSDTFAVELNPTAFEELERNPDIGDYVLVEFAAENTKGKKIYYIGKLLSEIDSVNENDYELTFLRKSEKMEGNFYFPDVPDIATVAKRDIKMILPQPLNYGKTKRQNSYYSFEIKFNLDIR